MRIIYLKPRSGFITELRSDTLWGMICWGIRNVYGNEVIEELLNTYINDMPEFIITTAFPYRKEKGKILLYFPKPLFPIEPYIYNSRFSDEKERLERNIVDKKNKKKPFLNHTAFQKLINKECTLEDAIQQTESINIDSVSVTHNTIDRFKGATLNKDGVGQLFHKDEFFFRNNSENDFEEAGLFFLIKGNSDKAEAAMRWLSHVGLGGDRNTGKGYFDLEFGDFNIDEPENYNAVVNLSLYYPSIQKNELSFFKDSHFFNYQLEKRQGYMGFLKYAHFEKPETQMFKEGSVFPVISNLEFYGNIKTLKEKNIIKNIPHSVYQFGFGFMIKIKI